MYFNNYASIYKFKYADANTFYLTLLSTKYQQLYYEKINALT